MMTLAGSDENKGRPVCLKQMERGKTKISTHPSQSPVLRALLKGRDVKTGTLVNHGNEKCGKESGRRCTTRWNETIKKLTGKRECKTCSIMVVGKIVESIFKKVREKD